MLWQPSAPGEPAWESLWGPGRPGWHIECSALAMRELGTTIDLHGGGTDLIFPHHECESAQSEAATGSVFVRHWMHVGMVGLGGEKMSKSLGNLVFVHELLEQGHDPAAIRLALLSQSYRLGLGVDRTRCSRTPRTASSVGGWRAEAMPAWRPCGPGSTTTWTLPGAIAAIDEEAEAGRGVGEAAALLGVRL